ncbi:hypothetical protein MTY66_11810 [Mycolicibacterium sp. TY66]|nr:hypothetical protein MTY66_11810 [Mycolicibacterium sp. TY66]BCJ82780.1 hypothetical protein MTY81_41530 [Mycolicibacterium sp. TY81]
MPDDESTLTFAQCEDIDGHIVIHPLRAVHRRCRDPAYDAEWHREGGSTNPVAQLHLMMSRHVDAMKDRPVAVAQLRSGQHAGGDRVAPDEWNRHAL